MKHKPPTTRVEVVPMENNFTTKWVLITERIVMNDHRHRYLLVSISPKFSVSSIMKNHLEDSAMRICDRNANVKYEFG